MSNLQETAADFLKKEVDRLSVRKFSFYLLVSFLILFFGLTLIIVFYSTEEFEAEFSRELQEYRSPILDQYMEVVSFFGERPVAIGMIAGAVVLFMLASRFREAVFMFLTSFGSILNYFLKILFNRSRPTDTVVEILTIAENQSFPSGHTVHYVVYFGMLIVLVFRMKGWNVWFRYSIILFSIVLIVSVPFSRVYLGAHWTTDVMAGVVLGIILLTILLQFYFKKSNQSNLQQSK